MTSKKIGLVIFVLVAAGYLGLLAYRGVQPALAPGAAPTSTPAVQPPAAPAASTPAPKPVPKLVSAVPQPGSVLEGVPTSIKLTFDRALAAGANLTVAAGVKDYSLGSVKYDAARRIISRSMDPNAPDGAYVIAWRACISSSCASGKIDFSIKRQGLDQGLPNEGQ